MSKRTGNRRTYVSQSPAENVGYVSKEEPNEDVSVVVFRHARIATDGQRYDVQEEGGAQHAHDGKECRVDEHNVACVLCFPYFGDVELVVDVLEVSGLHCGETLP